MRRGMLLVMGLAMAGAVTLDSATARQRSLPDALFGIITAPVDAIVGTTERIGRPIHRQRRPKPQRSRPSASLPERPPASVPSVPTRREPAGETAKAAGAPASPAPGTITRKETGPDAPQTNPGTGAGTAALTAGVAAGAGAIAASPPVPNSGLKPRSAVLALPETTPAPSNVDSQPTGKLAAKSSLDSTAATRDRFPLGVVGPLAWPGAYEDVIGFALLPQRYAESLRTRGIGEVMNTLFKPGALASRIKADIARSAETAAPATAAGAKPLDQCSGGTTLPNWPTAEIEGSIKLTATQRTALEELRTSIGEAAAAIKAACRNEVALPPVERIRSLQNTLWIVRDAAIMIRAPLAKFYDSLAEEQKKPFILSGPQPDLRAMAMNAEGPGRDEIARMCGMSKSAEWPSRGIDMYLQPNEAQRASLENMQKKSFEMAQFLLASCLQPIPATPPGRLDAAVDRLTAIIFATSNISLALNDFYNQLSDQQKSKITALSRQ